MADKSDTDNDVQHDSGREVDAFRAAEDSATSAFQSEIARDSSMPSSQDRSTASGGGQEWLSRGNSSTQPDKADSSLEMKNPYKLDNLTSSDSTPNNPNLEKLLKKDNPENSNHENPTRIFDSKNPHKGASDEADRRPEDKPEPGSVTKDGQKVGASEHGDLGSQNGKAPYKLPAEEMNKLDASGKPGIPSSEQMDPSAAAKAMEKQPSSEKTDLAKASSEEAIKRSISSEGAESINDPLINRPEKWNPNGSESHQIPDGSSRRPTPGGEKPSDAQPAPNPTGDKAGDARPMPNQNGDKPSDNRPMPKPPRETPGDYRPLPKPTDQNPDSPKELDTESEQTESRPHATERELATGDTIEKRSDGTQILKTPNGDKVTVNPDGSHKIEGNVKEIKQNGDFTEITFADGAKVSMDKQGIRTVERGDQGVAFSRLSDRIRRPTTSPPKDSKR